MATYISPEQHERHEHHEQAHELAERMAKLQERQAAATRHNLHNFAQLERAGFPGAVPVEFNYWVNSRVAGLVARKLMNKSVIKGEISTRVITTDVKDGYFVPFPTKSGGASDSGYAITADGTVYSEATWEGHRNAASVHRAPHRGLTLQRFENPGTPLARYKGPDKYHATRIFTSPADIEEVQVKGTENLASSFELVTKKALTDAGIAYVPLDAVETSAESQSERLDDTEKMPAAPAPEPIPLPGDELTTVRMPRVNGADGGSDELVNPVDYMPFPK